MSLKNEVDPLQYSREDEANGGYLVNGGYGKGTRKIGRLAGGVRDKITMGLMKARMAALWRDGVMYKDIADQVSDEFKLEGDERISVNGIHYHIKKMLDYWREKGLVHMDERQAMILARYDQIEVLATEAYFASMRGKTVQNFERQIERARSKNNDPKLKEKVKTKKEQGQALPFHDNGEIADNLILTQEKIKEYSRVEDNLAGDPRFLQILVDINHKRSQLWGLLSRADQSSQDQEYARLSDEAREQRLAAVLNAAMTRKTQAKGNLAKPAPLGVLEDKAELAQPKTSDDWDDDDDWDIDDDDKGGAVEWE